MVKYLVIHNGSHHFKLIDAKKNTYFIPFWERRWLSQMAWEPMYLQMTNSRWG